jgi:hypothetical protein
MEVTGDDHYIYTTHSSYYYTLVIVQDSKGELLQLEIELHYE